LGEKTPKYSYRAKGFLVCSLLGIKQKTKGLEGEFMMIGKE
jgi:hypothetical protein